MWKCSILLEGRGEKKKKKGVVLSDPFTVSWYPRVTSDHTEGRARGIFSQAHNEAPFFFFTPSTTFFLFFFAFVPLTFGHPVTRKAARAVIPPALPYEGGGREGVPPRGRTPPGHFRGRTRRRTRRRKTTQPTKTNEPTESGAKAKRRRRRRRRSGSFQCGRATAVLPQWHHRPPPHATPAKRRKTRKVAWRGRHLTPLHHCTLPARRYHRNHSTPPLPHR